MSKSSGGPSQVISVPKGGGAIKGIGETFSSDLFTGTGHINVPITLPPGRNGTQPQLHLSYSTGGGNSPFGLGWGMGGPEITRRTSGGLPRYLDGPSSDQTDPSESSDTFILSGTEGLVPMERLASGVTRYRPRTETLFALIEHHTAAGQNFWRVRTKDGLVSFYGTERPADAGPEWEDPTVLADPRDRERIFSWKLSRTEDPFGNKIVYEYRRDRVDDGRRAWNQLYLERALYADYNDEDGAERFLIAVALEYSDRPDPFSSYRAGFEIRTRLRCDRLVIRTHPGEDQLVRSYQFHYQSAGHNRVSLLTGVELIGGDGVDRFPPLSFGYTRFEPQGRRFFPLEGRELPERSLASADIELADLFGRGLPDIVQMNGSIRYWRNLGKGRFDLPRTMREAPSGVDLADPGVRLVDANGDGRVDLAVLTEPLPGYFPLTLNGEWDRRSFQAQRVAPSFSLIDPEVHLVDLNGDGVTDAIRSGARFELFFNDTKEGWNETIQLERRDADDFPDVSFADPRVRWSDMSGDGLQDVVLTFDGSVEYWPNLGFGRFAPKVLMRNSPRLPFGYDPRRLHLSDVDGDGLTDIVYVDHGQVMVWINQGGDAWSDPITIDGTPPVNDLASIRLTDMLGTGSVGIVWSYDADGLMRDRMLYLDIAGPTKPYVLTEMANNIGAITRVEYASSTDFYLADQVRPETRWKTPLPFPVQVVARTETIDVLSGGKVATTYRYHHGCWDGGESEFRGFALVEQIDSQTFAEHNSPGLHDLFDALSTVEPIHFSPPTLTKTWFHVGPVGEEHGDWNELDWSAEYWPDDPPLLDHVSGVNSFLRSLPDRPSRRAALRTLRGSVLRTEIFALDGSEFEDRPYTVTEQAYGIREEEPANGNSGRERIFFSHTLAQRVTQWERGDDPMTQFEFKQNYDAFGQPRDQLAIACPRGWRRLEDRIPEQTPFLATYVQTEYAESDSEEFYCKDRIARTTSHQLKQIGEITVFDLKDAIVNPAALEIIGQTLTYYDGESFVGLPFGRIGRFGAPVRSEQLVLTEEILQRAHSDGEIPPYLSTGGGPVAWTADYPESFRETVPALAGYVFHDGTGPEARGYFTPSKRTRFDFQEGPNGRGLATALADDAGAATTIEFDSFSLLPERVTDVLGLITTSRFDYRVLQPLETIDPNGNRVGYAYSGLGSLSAIAIMGKEGEGTGDTLEAPSTRFEYDFLAFANSPPEARQPISVRTIQRQHHINEDIPLEQRDAVITRVEYSDGFGRLIQRRIQAEAVRFGNDAFGTDIIPTDQQIAPGATVGRVSGSGDPPNVLVTGFQVYDNKGQIVQQFEPFYSTGFAYAAPGPAERGRASKIFYDPRGQVIRTVHTNGSIKRITLGIPRSLDTPEDFVPTPWETYTYDPNDNAATFEGEHNADPSHFNTPASIELDPLGRAIKSVAHTSASESILIRTEYDIRGNITQITDPLGRFAFRYVYDLSSSSGGARVLREDRLGSGVRRIVFDASGRELERRDSKGALVLQAYDTANRPVRLWARDSEDLPVTLRQLLVYGDAAGLDEPERDNLLGRIFRNFDEAGLIEMSSYDFKGNLLRQVRRVIRDEELLAVMGAGGRFQVDWEAPGAEAILEDRLFQTDMFYDALNRLTRVLYPVDVEGDRKTVLPEYGPSGSLERMLLRSGDAEPQVFVHHIAYNAKGQRSLIAYGNGWMTRYGYEPDTFYLSRVRTERFVLEDPFTFVPAGGLLQDVVHVYDLNGNIVRIRDRSPGCGIPNTPAGPDALDRVFTYDVLNQLVRATGREHVTRAPSAAPWLDALTPTNQDTTQTRAYFEEYDYDVAGNLLELRHRTSNTANDFTRSFLVQDETNRVDSFSQGESTFGCEYDAAGNLIRHTLSQFFVWNHSDRLHSFRIQAGDGPPSVQALYLYDALGQRVKKLVRHAGGSNETTTYVGNSFEHHTTRSGVPGEVAGEQNLLHLMDDQRRIALVRIGEPFADDSVPAVRYDLSDHLGSSVITLDESGTELRREEYYPHGGTSFGSFALKRYRFTGRERDEESGLTYHGHRYYAPSLMRWISPDPAGRADGLNLYRYARNQPTGFVDPEGTSAWSWTKDLFSSIWSGTKSFARFNWTGDFTAFGHDFQTTLGDNPQQWTNEYKDITWNYTKRTWGKIKQIAGNIIGWASSNKKLAIGAAIGAAALIGIGAYFKGKWILNWVIAPAIRVGTNAAFGMALWGNAGFWIGAATGLVHGIQMARAGTYKKPQGWLAFAFDNTWSIYNSFVGSFFATFNTAVMNPVNKTSSEDYGGLYYEEPLIGSSSTTIGNVTVGKAVPLHESVHAWQARALGPFYIPAVLTGYVLAVFPYWLIWKDCNVGGWNWFTKGIYPNTWHEMIAYASEGDRCSCC